MNREVKDWSDLALDEVFQQSAYVTAVWNSLFKHLAKVAVRRYHAVRPGHVQDNIRRDEIADFLMGVRCTPSDGHHALLCESIRTSDQEMPTPPPCGYCCCVHSAGVPGHLQVS